MCTRVIFIAPYWHCKTALLPLKAALSPPRSVERLLLVAAFVVSQYNTIKRQEKPFKNLEGATYELVYPEKGIRAIGEKVKHSALWPVMAA